MGYKPKSPNFQLLSHAALPGTKNQELDCFARDTVQRLNVLENKTGVSALNLARQAPLAPAPAKGLLNVTALPNTGLFKVGSTLPEFISPAISGNPSRTPLYHQVQYSPSRRFDANVTDLPKGHQVYWPVQEIAGSFLNFRFRSSADGINWNEWTVAPGVQG